MQLRGTNIVVDTVSAKKPVISGSGATRALNEYESGSTVLFDRANGIVFTLPDPRPGISYDFAVCITSNTVKVITNTTTSTSVMIGTLGVTDTTDDLPSVFTANGTTHKAVSMNNTTTGGKLGTGFRVTAISANTWYVSGMAVGTGVLGTPFATS